jgi:hypothetical protein
MKTLSLSVLLTLSVNIPALAQSLDDSQSCVIVYSKNDSTQPNLTIACDGQRVLTHVVKTENKLNDPQQFRKELYTAFQAMVNPSARKQCKEYNLEGVWWASCGEQK